MATTSLIVETLIAGLQALLWLALGLLLFLGVRWIDFSALKDWVSLILFFVIAVYVQDAHHIVNSREWSDG